MLYNLLKRSHFIYMIEYVKYYNILFIYYVFKLFIEGAKCHPSS